MINAGINHTKSASIEANSHITGLLVNFQTKIPIPAITKQMMSVFAHPPMPYFIQSEKIRILCKAETHARKIATVLCCASNAKNERRVIINKTNLVVLCGFDSPFKIDSV